MASPPIPPALEHLVTRPFSFYPPILNVEHNEWLYRKATWSEILVVNCKSGAEIWIPRRFFGEVSSIDDPVLIVGLTRELEFKGGAVWPYQRRVLSMPLAVGGSPASPAPVPPRASPAPVIGIRLESNDRRILKLIGGALAVAILLSILALNIGRIAELRQRSPVYTIADQSYLDLNGRDDYFSVVQKLGPPSLDRWQPGSGALHIRALGYPDRKYTVILMGADRDHAAYIGALDEHWKPVHSVPLPSGGTTFPLLRQLQRF